MNSFLLLDQKQDVLYIIDVFCISLFVFYHLNVYFNRLIPLLWKLEGVSSLSGCVILFWQSIILS